eukprot:TRINITY_DN2578_c1_g1_i2.p1 TRINITY_DN2578_c1_g1~~TRINITY_DN2578_c1_g1_i2.p1  ORF type:complete len:862 (-),score=300.70 TRINITY_DN2578_c1_g1_i2:139-2724(-)
MEAHFFSKGSIVWWKSPSNSWVPARVESQKGDAITLKPTLDDGSQDPDAEEHEVDAKEVVRIQGDAIPKVVDDMVSLSDMNEPNILHNLRARYNRDDIYTYVGPILISINPYKPVSIYGPDALSAYQMKPLGALPPHIYAISEVSYRSMLKERKNRSILISGETGAGKTEATKYIMKYLASVTGEAGRVERQLMQAHPILEAFGNAKTVQNDNSSRFGKFFQIFFSNKGEMTGAIINHYLLEKSRICNQGDSERSYHVFYQLLAGASQDEKLKLRLTDADNFTYLSESGCVSMPYVDDAKNLQILREAFTELNIKGDEQGMIFQILAAILHLGNLSFQKDPKRNDASLIGNKNALEIVAELLGTSDTALETALCNRNMSARAQSTYIIPLKVDDAMSNRDALSKMLYAAIFDWLIQRINTILVSSKPDHFVGVLDIFGFEIFDLNSFEQFCINYANEKLQQFFNKHLFKVEQEEYVREKIDWSKVDFADNLQVVELIEKKPMGILSILDEECNFPKGTDETFLQKVSQQFKTSKCYKQPLRIQGVFTITHYAGDVTYDTVGFLHKNKDTVNADLVRVIHGSSLEFLVNLFPKDDAGAAKGAKPVPVRGQPMKAQQQTKKTTLGTQFRAQLTSLMTTLSATEPHFIRAIKPNSEKIPNSFDGMNALRQLKYAGVLETVRIRASGYSYRPTYEEFLERFRILAPEMKGKTGTPRNLCEILLPLLHVEKTLVKMGLTKLFMKEREYAIIMARREESMGISAKIIQRYYKTYRLSKDFKLKRQSALVFQQAIRYINARKELKSLKKIAQQKKREEMERKKKEEAEKKLQEEKARKIQEEAEKKKKLEEERKRKVKSEFKLKNMKI